MNVQYYDNLLSAIDTVPIPDPVALSTMSEDALTNISEGYTNKLTALGNTSNQALTGVTGKACEQLALIAPILELPTDPEEILTYLSKLVAIFKKPYDDIIAENTALIPTSIVISTGLVSKLSSINSAIAEAQALRDANPLLPPFTIPIPTAPSVELVTLC